MIKSVVRENQLLVPSDIAICMSNGNRALVGKAGQFEGKSDSLVHTVGAFCAIFRPNQNYDPNFVRHLFGADSYQKHLDVILAGSAINNLKGSDIQEIVADCPTSKPEQTKIAEILSTVDRAIEQTEALIAKQQRLKTGLMQDLLIRGIDQHGNLRSEQTHEFKDSPLGRIPVEWEVKRIDELLANVDPPMRSGPFGSALLKEELVESGVPLLGIDNVHTEKFVASFARFVHYKKAETLKRYYVRPRDIMITIMGTVGRCCVVPDDIGTALSSKHTWTISLDQKVYSSYLPACKSTTLHGSSTTSLKTSKEG